MDISSRNLGLEAGYQGRGCRYVPARQCGRSSTKGGGVSLANKVRAPVTQNNPDAVRAGLAEIADAPDVASGSPVGEVYNRAMRTAMQALQLLLTLPFLNFQIWQKVKKGRTLRKI